MTSFFIGIAGGSGTGKTALAEELRQYFGKEAAVLHMDNYQRFGEKLRKLYGMKNWDHPEAINWDKLLKDLILLKNGQAITIKLREQKTLKKVKTVIFPPSKIIIIEGYLLFYKTPIRKLINFRIYLEASEDARVKRRSKIKGKGDRYIKKVVLPMHRRYIEPTKKYANLVINTDKSSIKHCCKQVVRHLPNRF
ncbi:hypothetical protein AMJ48_01925 [Parcubacteria bacterium DG_74_1]|nr:MAG: hypothetical protein AMJ48_01925 [Parcubacteria bacterium DG_74_1]